MFEYGNEKADPAKIIVWIALSPFALFWLFHRSLLTAFLLEASVMSIISFVFGIEVHRQWKNIRKLWFIKSILFAVCVVHPLFLAIAWYLDARYPFLISGWGSIFVSGFLGGVVEMVVIGE